jgi:hypothetical protein
VQFFRCFCLLLKRFNCRRSKSKSCSSSSGTYSRFSWNHSRQYLQFKLSFCKSKLL